MSLSLPQPTLISIITPVHNGAEFVADTVRSIQSQSFKSWELLIIDDASVDQSVAVVSALAADDGRIRIIRLRENSGAAVARNTGLQAAKGRYIAFADSDDLWAPNKLERQFAFMEKAGCAFSFTAMERVDSDMRHISWAGVPDRVCYKDMLKTNYVGCSTVMYDTAVVGRLEMPLIRRRQDFGLWLKMLKKVPYGYGINEPLVKYRVREGSVSSNKAISAGFTWEVYRHIEGLSVVKSAWYLLNQTSRALLRNKMPAVARRLGLLHAVRSLE